MIAREDLLRHLQMVYALDWPVWPSIAKKSRPIFGHVTGIHVKPNICCLVN